MSGFWFWINNPDLTGTLGSDLHIQYGDIRDAQIPGQEVDQEGVVLHMRQVRYQHDGGYAAALDAL